MLILSFSVSAENNNKFESVTVGFKVFKPNDWRFVSAYENLVSLNRIRLNNEEFHKLMLKHSTAPLVAMMKYPEPFDDLNPSFKVTTKPLGQFKGLDPKVILDRLIPQFGKIFQNLDLVQPPEDTMVAGLNAAYMRIHYSLTIPDGRVFPTSSELWVVPRGSYFFILGAATRQDEKTGSRVEINKILDTVEIQPVDINFER